MGHVVVVGAASGIGAELVGRLVAAGADVIALDHRAPARSDVRYVPCDLRDPASVDAAAADLPPGLDAVAHVAGVPGTHPPEEVLAVNFLGMRHLVRAILPKVREFGAVTVVASTAGVLWTHRLDDLKPLLATDSVAEGLAWLADREDDGYPVYNLSKEAVLAFVLGWSSTVWRERRVRLNTVSPGPVETPILADFEESMGKDLLDAVRLATGRHATVADVAPVIQAVCGPDFGWMIGQDLVLDGGFTTGAFHGDLLARAPVPALEEYQA